MIGIAVPRGADGRVNLLAAENRPVEGCGHGAGVLS